MCALPFTGSWSWTSAATSPVGRYTVTAADVTLYRVARPEQSRPDLTDERIARSALDVLARDGLTALSFRRVGAELGASHMAVHRHCGSFEGMLDLCADYLAGQLPEVDPKLPWSTVTELMFTALYETMAAHWELIALLRGRPWRGSNMIRRFSEPAVASGLAAGLTSQEVVQCYRELYVFAVGCALTKEMFGPTDELEALGEADFPAMVQLHDIHIRPDQADMERFVRGIRTLISSWDPQAGQHEQSRVRPRSSHRSPRDNEPAIDDPPRGRGRPRAAAPRGQ